jgi:hypothetical protein
MAFGMAIAFAINAAKLSFPLFTPTYRNAEHVDLPSLTNVTHALQSSEIVQAKTCQLSQTHV